MLAEASQSVEMSTDSESVAAESGLSESESEAEPVDLQELRVPLERGWKRVSILKGMRENFQFRGEVYYTAPGSQTKIKSFAQLEPFLASVGGGGAKQANGQELTKENFSFSLRALVGSFLMVPPPQSDQDYIRMTEEEVQLRLEQLKGMFPGQSQLNVEQRIEIAKQQQAARDAKKLAKEEVARNKEKAKLAKEQEKNERLEAQRKERELKTQQAMEVSGERDGRRNRNESELIDVVFFLGSSKETRGDGKVEDGGDATQATGNCVGYEGLSIDSCLVGDYENG